jgi:large subunit ribosomal protein LP0
MHEIRKALRGRGVVLMGKNTMVRRAVRILMAEFPEYERLLPHIKGMFYNFSTRRDSPILT